MRYHLTPVRMAIIKKSTRKYWKVCGEKKPAYTALGNVTWYSQDGDSIKNLKIELPYDHTIPLLGTYPEKNMV